MLILPPSNIWPIWRPIWKTESDDNDLLDAERTVFAVIRSNLNQAQTKSPHAVELLSIAAYCAAEKIPWELWNDVFGEDDELSDPAKRQRALGVLENWSLVRVDRDDPAGWTLSLHRLVQEVVWAQLDERGEGEATLDAAIGALTANYPQDPTDVREWDKIARLQSHAETALGHVDDGKATENAAWLMAQCGTYRYARAEYGLAEKLMRNTVAARKSLYGPDDPQTATVINNLAELLRITNRLAEAEPLLSRALAIDRGKPWPRSPQYCDPSQQSGLIAAGDEPFGGG